MGYLTNKMLMYFDPITTDISESVLNVSIGKKNVLSRRNVFVRAQICHRHPKEVIGGEVFLKVGRT